MDTQNKTKQTKPKRSRGRPKTGSAKSTFFPSVRASQADREALKIVAKWHGVSERTICERAIRQEIDRMAVDMGADI